MSLLVLESQVDWITAVTVTARSTAALWQNAEVLIEFENRQGNKIKMFSTHGYIGQNCGRIAYGRMGDRGLLQIAGNYAAGYTPGILALADHVTRLDLQITLQQEPWNVAYAGELYSTRPNRLHGAGNAPGYTYIESSKGGSTLYVGRGASAQTGRLYDKQHQSGAAEYKHCWRAEVQLRREMADKAAHSLPMGDSWPGWVMAFVSQWFRGRGVDLGIDPGTPVELRPPPKEKTDASRKLAWLRKVVRPAVDWLRDESFTEETVRALGLETLIDVTSLPDFDGGQIDPAAGQERMDYDNGQEKFNYENAIDAGE